MDSAVGHPTLLGWGCPIRTSADHSLLAAPRGLSQPSTSFIGSRCQGIHRAPFLARRLDLSKPPSRQDLRSHKKNVRYRYLLIYSSVLQVRRRDATKRPDVRRAPSGTRQSSTRAMRLAAPRYGWSVSPRLLRHGTGTSPAHPAKNHYIQPPRLSARGWSRGDSNP